MIVDLDLILFIVGSITYILVLMTMFMSAYYKMLLAKIELKKAQKNSTLPNSNKVKGRKRHQ